MSRRDVALRNELLGGVIHKAVGNVGAAVAVDPFTDESHVYTLTANATVSAPVASGPLFIGDKLFLVFIQDVTGTRTLAWNAAWRNAPAMTAGTNAQRASFEFRWDGVAWQFVGGSTAFA